jgi:hypothetical protein
MPNGVFLRRGSGLHAEGRRARSAKVAAPVRNLAVLLALLPQNTTVLRHLFVVSREHVWLYTHLRERFEDDPNVGVILDRRVGERRSASMATRHERRERERRRPPSPEEDLTVHSHYIVEL